MPPSTSASALLALASPTTRRSISLGDFSRETLLNGSEPPSTSATAPSSKLVTPSSSMVFEASRRRLLEVEERRFDVAIVDLNLPGISGADLIREFRDRSLAMEVLVLTGHATVENAVRTLKDGAYDFLSKPCNLDELEAVVRKAHEKGALVQENRLHKRGLR